MDLSVVEQMLLTIGFTPRPKVVLNEVNLDGSRSPIKIEPPDSPQIMIIDDSSVSLSQQVADVIGGSIRPHAFADLPDGSEYIFYGKLSEAEIDWLRAGGIVVITSEDFQKAIADLLKTVP